MNTLLRALRILGGTVALATLVPWVAQAQVTQDWVRSTPSTYGDMIALDKDDNAYVAGSVPWSTMLITK